MGIKTNPIYGLMRTLILYLTGRINYNKEEIGKKVIMEDGKIFTVFRRVVIRQLSGEEKKPEGLFIIRFTPSNITIEENIRYSKKVMLIFQGFHGFRSKYWMVDYNTGECQGIYEWDTYEDAVRYSKSIAVRFMTKRSQRDSVNFWILQNTEENRNFKFE